MGLLDGANRRETMFRESLLESSLSRRHQKRWPMAIAFVLESIAAGIVIVVPLLSTGVIPVSAHVHHITPLPMVRVDTERVHSSFPSRNNVLHSSDSVVPVSNNPNQIHYGDSRPVTRSVIPNAGFDVGPRPPGPDVAACSDCLPVVQPPIHEKPISLSHLSEAQLVHRVEPVYPRMAVLASLQGEVRLHAIIARDGTIQSLSVTSGQPILAQAALEAVRQWRYRPYLLNGKAVEVETFITVNFRKDR
jgi:protein TonB